MWYCEKLSVEHVIQIYSGTDLGMKKGQGLDENIYFE